MAEKKKPKTVDEIVAEYQKYHYHQGKDFKERIKKFEEFHDSENIHQQQFIHHADYVVFGKPTDNKNFPGAYNEAYKVLDKHLKEDTAKLEDEDKLAEILETYVDNFLQKAIGKGYTETIKHAEKEGVKGKDLRELKQSLLAPYLTDEKGRPISILDEGYIRGLKKQKKIDLIEELKGIGEKMKKGYAINLIGKATSGLISEEDRLDLAKYIAPKFKKFGWEHEDSHITRSAGEQLQHYSALITGSGDALKKAGYKLAKEEEKKK
ncbi:MAG: hypothetical protein ABH824_06620 [Nanoarchaeota archaeon]|nr:hypothetical protein [Nanoarchaeota archaeon]MBU1632020.1 hypothetical protein [Nanoarchaeota archaeon]MBU1876403.1 hypothetical protein [Nanoarchaeota archaeon]